MKNLILFLVLIIPFSIIAQDKVNAKEVLMNDQAQEWMTKISSNSDMRSKMMSMMIEETRGNKIEMTKLVNALMDNKETHKIMLAEKPTEVENRNITIDPRGMSGDSVRVMKMYNSKQMPKK